jgi:hypothetical protein
LIFRTFNFNFYIKKLKTGEEAVYRKSFSSVSKLIALILILTCSVLFTNIAIAQPKDTQSNPSSEQSDNSGESKTFLYVAVAAVLVVGAIYLFMTNKSDKDKKTESEKNINIKDSTAIDISDTTQIKK